MRLRKYSLLAFALASFGFFSCVDSQQTDEAILDVDKRAIAEYLEDNPIANVQEFNDEVTGIRIFWQELSNSGQEAAIGDTVSVDYTGRLLTNRVFDTSIEQVARDNNIFSEARAYIPLRFLLGRNQLIQGFEFAVEQMELGDKATVVMPSLWGYGNAAAGDIPANSPLIFELDLVRVDEGPENN